MILIFLAWVVLVFTLLQFLIAAANLLWHESHLEVVA